MGIKVQFVLLWAAVACYAGASIVFLWNMVKLKDSMLHKTSGKVQEILPQGSALFRWGIRLALVGLVPHTVALLLRWLETGHGPYMRRYEVYSSDVWVALVIFLIIQWRQPRLRVSGALVLPASFLLIGMAVLSSPEIQPLPASFGTYWLIVHILFAKLAYSCFLIGTALALLYLLKEGKLSRWSVLLPDLATMHEQSYRFISFGFLMQAVMIATGAIWANKAWGRYWNWDPVETWSLISWIFYGFYLHLVRTFGWNGRRPALLALAAVLVLIFALFGIGLVYDSLHSPYIR